MNKRLFLKMSLVTLPILALFSQPVLAEENIHFSSCKEAWANGYSDIHEGEPGYSAKLDRDHDGVACELKNAPKGAFKAKQSTAIQINTSSATTSGWVKQDGAWYYFDGNGNLVKNAWQGNYYLKSDGKMAKGEWVYDATYQAWYYLTSDGSYAYSTWQGNYYLKSDGKMAVNEWVDGGRYYVGADGVWKEGQASTVSSSNDSNSEYSAALGKAKSYNSLFHMSKKRMYRQLTSDFDKFSNDAAQYAIDHLDD
ncbi:TPA: Ltp family lipoprotein [Streptococcus pneumoniae]|uniref:N-acetylmuramoyl-L-alanine amidase family protein n=1 Tax=Streptococcus pneumoniae TaxID=1313 RepID=UPI000A076FDD|nr:N-acetylmuramoyl-L-alanine amidase family protein [Streptococcus pneumoniae]HEV9394872.1 N-acetylmuramoyl-L-alanine amidase family protein [Streptococcus pneumoniae]HEW2553144.1 N-acetylmuramoyl-L-alanine amidase family protein [Streptococcus pneumoniae]HEW5536684.1 N-acetylmuramoyl-L-alanine amidase family protein [Streptococcus pneumoniae]